MLQPTASRARSFAFWQSVQRSRQLNGNPLGHILAMPALLCTILAGPNQETSVEVHYPMDIQLWLIFTLTFLIHLIGTLAYAVRIAGVRTRRIVVALSLFNLLMLLSRTANSFQAPLLAKRVEIQLAFAPAGHMEADFRWLLLATTLATLSGAFLIPSFQRLFTTAVGAFAVYRSVPRLMLHSFSRAGVLHLRESLVLPASTTVTEIYKGDYVPMRLVIFNALVEAVWTVGVFAALYAGYLNPSLRVTASSLSAVINGGATILMALAIDPMLSIMTDDVLEGKRSELFLRRSVVWLVARRFAGTLIAQALLFPAAMLITLIAQ